ncbi:hypothetical protein Tco_0032918 [Tanacetum coccineum]
MLTARKRVHPFPTRISANRRRFCYVSSSPSPSPHKRRKVSPHSSLSISLSLPSSIGLSCKRCRSPITYLSLIRADLLPPRKRLRGSPSVVHQETSLEDSTERGFEASIKVSIGVGHEAGIKAGVEAGTKRMEEFKEETSILTSRLEIAEAARTNLHERVRALTLSEQSLQDTLKVERERFARVQHHLGYVSEELRQSRMSRFADQESLRRIETFMIRRFGYRP